VLITHPAERDEDEYGNSMQQELEEKGALVRGQDFQAKLGLEFKKSMAKIQHVHTLSDSSAETHVNMTITTQGQDYAWYYHQLCHTLSTQQGGCKLRSRQNCAEEAGAEPWQEQEQTCDDCDSVIQKARWQLTERGRRKMCQAGRWSWPKPKCESNGMSPGCDKKFKKFNEFVELCKTYLNLMVHDLAYANCDEEDLQIVDGPGGIHQREQWEKYSTHPEGWKFANMPIPNSMPYKGQYEGDKYRKGFCHYARYDLEREFQWDDCEKLCMSRSLRAADWATWERKNSNLGCWTTTTTE